MAAAYANLTELLTGVGFNANARGILTDANKEDLILPTLQQWSDDDVDNLIRSLRKEIVGYVAATNNAAAVPGNPLYVSVRAIENTKTVCYVLRHMVRCQRVPDVGDLSDDIVRDWKVERLNEADYEDPDDYPKLAKADHETILSFIEDFPEQLARFTGIGGRPLAYVIREDEALPADPDPMHLAAVTRYRSVRDEITRRAALTGVPYKADNRKIFEILHDAIKDFESVKVWVKGHVRSKNGWNSFKGHYLGTAQLDGIADRADSKIETLVYHGEKTRYGLEKHVSLFKQAHLDLAKAGSEPDGRSKVRKFLQSVKTSEMQTAIGVVKATDAYLNDFEATVNYLRRFVSSSLPRTRSVASMHAGAGSSDAPPKPPNFEYRWFKKPEFDKLPEGHQEWLKYEQRRRGKEGNEGNPNSKKEKRKIKNLVRKEKRKLNKLKAKIKATKADTKKDKNGGDSDSSSEG